MGDGVRLGQNGIAGYQRISIVINWSDAGTNIRCAELRGKKLATGLRRLCEKA
jgi:hypothetical protein